MRAVPPTAFRWLPPATALGAAGAVAVLAAVVAYLVVGVWSAPVDWVDLITGSTWDPARDRFGAASMIWGTAAVSAVALALAAPVGWATAVALGELVPRRVRQVLRATVEILAVVPSIVYGLIGIAYLRPLVSDLGGVPGGDGLLTAALVLAVMILPTVVAVSMDALADVADSDREAGRALGLNPSEVIRRVVLPRARRGLGAAALLGLVRALGETIAVYLVIGRADGRLPSGLREAAESLLRPGQSLTTKLNSPESLLAGTSGAHWAALCALGILLVSAATLTTAAGRRQLAAGQEPSGLGRLGRLGRLGSLGRLRAPVPGSVWPGRRGRDLLARSVTLLALGVSMALVAGLLAAVIGRAGSAFDPRFWLEAARGASGGGVRDQVVGTAILVVTAGVVAAPIGLALGLAMSTSRRRRVSSALRSATLVMAGLPSIVVALWGYWLFGTTLGWQKSWLAGGLVLGVIAVPPVAVAVASSVAAMDPQRREAGRAMGLRPHQMLASVEIPQALPGLATGLLLGLARAAGETAPILFTATVFAGAATLPGGIVDAPVVALPTHIFTLAQDSADPRALAAAWGAALVLMVVAGTLVLAAGLVRRRLGVRR